MVYKDDIQDKTIEFIKKNNNIQYYHIIHWYLQQTNTFINQTLCVEIIPDNQKMFILKQYE